MSFDCIFCPEKFRSELNLNSHYLFMHEKYRGFCKSDKAIQLSNLINELKEKFKRSMNHQRINKILNMIDKIEKEKKYISLYDKNYIFIFFVLELSNHTRIKITNIEDQKDQKILEFFRNSVRDNHEIMYQMCKQFNVFWPKYTNEKNPLENEVILS